MILTKPQTIQTSNPLDTSIPKRIVSSARPSALPSKEESTTAEQRTAEQAQKQYEQRLVSELQARDRDVRAHEAAHVAAGGSLVVSGPSYTYQNGPDGRAYAIGGEVQLDVSPVANNPQATLEKSEQIRRAALAPADPSQQDMRVASNASQLASRARIDIAVQRREDAKLEEEQKSLEEEQNNADASVNIEETETASRSIADSFSPSLVESGSVEPAANQQAQPSAAISAFVSAAQTPDTEPSQDSQINQFV